MKDFRTLLLVTGAAFLFRVIQLLVFGNEIVVTNDHVNNINLGRNLAAGDFYGMLDTYWTPVYPFLIGIITFFVDSLVLPAIIVSLVGGTLIVALTYLLVRDSYGESYGVIAAALAGFSPHLINSIFALQSENIYTVFLIAALFIGWRGIKSGSIWLYFATGLLIGLAYLTRPEAFGYLLFFILFALVKDIWEGRAFSKCSFSMVGVLLIGFLVLAAPYIFYLKVETGQWTISGKLIANIAGGELRVDTGDEFEARSIDVTEKAKFLLLAVFYNLVRMQVIFAYLLPILTLIPFSLGLFGEKWGENRIRRELYLIGFCAFTVIAYSITVPQSRYFYLLFPIFFGWMTRGILILSRWTSGTFGNLMPARAKWLFEPKGFVALVLVFLLLYTLPVHFYLRATDEKWENTAYEERDAGLWLRENSEGTPVIFAASRRPVFYALGEHINPVTEDQDLNLRHIVEKNAEFVVLNDRTLDRNEFLTGMEKRLEADGRFEVVYEREDFPGYGIVIYRRKD